MDSFDVVENGCRNFMHALGAEVSVTQKQQIISMLHQLAKAYIKSASINPICFYYKPTYQISGVTLSQ
jgi:hypothetical protein